MVKTPVVSIKQLVEELAYRVSAPKSVSRVFIYEFIDILKEYLKNGCEIEIKRFGRFKVSKVKGYVVRHIKTKAPVNVKEYKRVKFKVSRKFFEEINNKIKV